jgi:hypothetical protein
MVMRPFILVLVLVLPLTLRADDEKKPAPKKDEAKKDEAKKDEAKKDEAKKPDEKKPDEKPKLAPDLVALPKELAAKLAKFDELGEPKREAVRLVCSLLNSLLTREPEKLAQHFHKDFKTHTGHGELTPTSPDEIKKMLEPLKEKPATQLTVEKLLDLDSVRVFTREECKLGKGGMFKKDPTPVADIMEDGDLVFLAKTRVKTWSGEKNDGEEEIFDVELFYVLRREGERLKAVVGE